MDSQRGAASQGCAIQLLSYTLFVNSMTGFVQGAEEGCIEEILIHTGGYSHIP